MKTLKKKPIDKNRRTMALKKGFFLSLKKRKLFGQLISTSTILDFNDDALLKDVFKYIQLHSHLFGVPIELKGNIFHVGRVRYNCFDTLIGKTLLLKSLFVPLIKDEKNTINDLIAFYIEDEVKKGNYKFIPNKIKLSLVFGVIAIIISAVPLFYIMSQALGNLITAVYFIFAIIGLFAIPKYKDIL